MEASLQPGRRSSLGAGRPGFTLIELLAAVAVIAILAALLFPVLGRVRQAAMQSGCLSNLRQIGTALALYLDDHRGTYPWQSGPRFQPSTVADVGLARDDPSDRSNRWDAAPVRAALAFYARDHAVWYCPAIPASDARRMETGSLPGIPPDPFGGSSASFYQANAYLFVNTVPHVAVRGTLSLRPRAGPVRQADVAAPSRLRVFQDFWNQGRGVHSGGINALRADGSAAWQRAVQGITVVAWWER